MVSGTHPGDPALLPVMDPAERQAIYDAMNSTMAPRTLRPIRDRLGDFGNRAHYFDLQIARPDSSSTSSRRPRRSSPAPFDRVCCRAEQIPAGDETRIAHGDFRLETGSAPDRARAVSAMLDFGGCRRSTTARPDLRYT